MTGRHRTPVCLHSNQLSTHSLLNHMCKVVVIDEAQALSNGTNVYRLALES
jgi:hypothetical protein